MKRALLSSLILGGLLTLALVRPAAAGEVTISAAASLKDSLSEVGAAFGREHPGTTVRFNFGSSTTLQQQVEQGAPVDIFIAAADRNANELEARRLVEPGLRRVIARGELVLIVPKDSRLVRLADLRRPEVRIIAVGGPTVPAGRYTRQSLTYLNLASVAKKFVNAKDVRAALSLVASGNADAGFVYRTDALASPEVKIIATVPDKAHNPIRYPMVLVHGGPNLGEARSFWAFVQSAAAQRVFKKWGFK
jgi:molybdate transport system substrate-binding protein